MKRLVKSTAIIVSIFLIVSAVVFYSIHLWSITIPNPEYADIDYFSREIEYPLVEKNGVHVSTLAHVKILEIFPGFYQDYTYDPEHTCILFKAEVIEDLHDTLTSGEIVYVELFPVKRTAAITDAALKAGVKHLATIDSCFIYSTLYRGGENTDIYDLNGEPVSSVHGTVLRPSTIDGEYLPIAGEVIDEEALDTIWYFPIDRHDSSFVNTNSLAELLQVLEEHMDPDYYEKKQERIYQSLKDEYDQAVMRRYILTASACGIATAMLFALYKATSNKE